MGQTREERTIKQVLGNKAQIQKFTPIATDMFLPNYSGVANHKYTLDRLDDRFEKKLTGIYFVTKDGDDSNDGKSVSASFLTIAKAVSEASSGDIVYVYPGTYAEKDIAITKNISIIGLDKRKTIIQAVCSNSSGIFKITTDGLLSINFSNLYIDETSDVGDGTYRAGIYIGASNLVINIDDCYINGGWDGVYFHTAVGTMTVNIRNCEIRSKYDCLGIWSDNTYVYVYDTLFRCEGSTGAAWGNERCVAFGNTSNQTIKLMNCDLYTYTDNAVVALVGGVIGVWSAAAAGLTADIINCNIIVECSNGSDAGAGISANVGATINVYNTYVYVYDADVTNYDLCAYNGGVINLYGLNKYTTKVVSGGTINEDWTNRTGDIIIATDSKGLKVGAGNDITLSHDGTNSELDNATGNFTIDSTGGIFLDAASGFTTLRTNGTSYMMNIASTTTDQTLMGLYSATGMHLCLTNAGYYNKDHDHAVTTDPTLFIHSATDPDTDNTQYMGLYHDQTDSKIIGGKGNIYISPPASSGVVLGGTKSTTGDPTAVEGLIYINTYDNKIRMYADGAWRDLSAW